MNCELPEEVKKIVFEGPGLGGTWRHAILEIYEPETGWPKEGTRADWIYKQQVLFCNGRAEDVVVLCPLWKILWWKAKDAAIEVYWWVRYYVWDKWRPNRWDKFITESPDLDNGEKE
jgi:hypothetical protein